MKLLWPLCKYLLFPLLLCWLFLVALVLQAPISWLAWKAEQYQRLPAGVSWQQLDGRLGQGQVSGLQVQNLALDHLQWSLPSWRLLLMIPRLEIRLSSQPDWLLQLDVSPSGSIRGQLKPGDMDLFNRLGLPLKLEGQLQGQLDFMLRVQQQGQLTCSHLLGEVYGEVQVLQPMPVDLGQISLQPSCTNEQQLEWLFSSELSNQHQLRINGQMTDTRWSFTGQAETQENAALAPILQLLQWRQQPAGVYRAQGGGRF